ncbi:hypothetical protein D3C73_1534150 [compost metagenome]
MRVETHLIVDRKPPVSPIPAYNPEQPTFAQYLSQALVANAASPIPQRVSQIHQLKDRKCRTNNF